MKITPKRRIAWLLFGSMAISGAFVNAQISDSDIGDDEDVFELSPFVVSSEEDDGYLATQTLAGTRIRTDLRDVGAAISVITEQFLRDTASTRADDLLVYTTNTEVSGPQGNYMGGGDGEWVSFQPVGSTRVRGLAEADVLKDFFLTDVPWDTYNVDRVDLQRGPNAVLFGIGSPAGIINASTKVAAFKNFGEASFRMDNFGTTRYTLDYNREIIKGELAVRIAALDDNTEYRQKPAFRDDTRVYGTLNWKPAFLNKGGNSAQFTAKVESGKIEANYPIQTPPIDHITPWFNHMNKETFPIEGGDRRTSAGSTTFNPWLARQPYGYTSLYFAIFPNVSSSHQESIQDSTPDAIPGGLMQGIAGYGDWAFNTQQPGYGIRPFKAKSITDPAIFDFYDHMIPGPNKVNNTGFDSVNLNFSQTFLGNKVGYEVAYDRQFVRTNHFTTMGSREYIISVDVVENLDDGTPNPNLGRPFTLGSGNGASASAGDALNETVRATGFAEYDFRDRKESWLNRFLGKHIFTATYTAYSTESKRRSWQPFYIGDIVGTTLMENNPITDDDRKVASMHYLGDSLLGASSATDANISRIHAIQEPKTGFVTALNPNTGDPFKAPVIMGNATRDFGWDNRPYTGGTKIKNEIESYTLVWQAHLLDGLVIPMFGYRKDTAEAWNAGAPTRNNAEGTVNVNDPTWQIPSDPNDLQSRQSYNKSDGISRTYSLVVKAPRFVTERLGGAGVSLFYNRSENFQPKPGRRDILGNFIPNPTGETEDYGVNLELMDGKLLVKINRYKTELLNDNASSSISTWNTINTEAYLSRTAVRTRAGDWQNMGLRGDSFGRTNFGVTSSNSKYGAGNQLLWQPMPQELSDPNVGWGEGGTYSQEAIDSWYDIQQDALDSWFANPLPDSMIQAWGMEGYDQPGYNASVNGGALSSVAVTGSTISEGTEIEIIAKPIAGLNISLNVSKTDARRVDLAGSYSDWVQFRYNQVQTLPMGNMRMWSGADWNVTNGRDFALGNYNVRIMPQYNLARALEGATVPELRPWRANVVANYTIQDGMFEGTNFGGSYRWMDKQVIGFALNDAEDGYDVNQKYYGPSEGALDLWASKKFKVNDKINWLVQVNIRNVFASDDLIPLTVQPDGSGGQYRIPEPRLIAITNTISF